MNSRLRGSSKPRKSFFFVRKRKITKKLERLPRCSRRFFHISKVEKARDLFKYLIFVYLEFAIFLTEIMMKFRNIFYRTLQFFFRILTGIEFDFCNICGWTVWVTLRFVGRKMCQKCSFGCLQKKALITQNSPGTPRG